MRESKVEEALRKAVTRAGGRCLKFVSPGTKGVPDRICLMPGRVIAFVETKRPGETVDPEGLQQFWQDEMQRLGFCTVVIDTPAAARAFVLELKQSVGRPTLKKGGDCRE